MAAVFKPLQCLLIITLLSFSNIQMSGAIRALLQVPGESLLSAILPASGSHIIPNIPSGDQPVLSSPPPLSTDPLAFPPLPHNTTLLGAALSPPSPPPPASILPTLPLVPPSVIPLPNTQSIPNIPNVLPPPIPNILN
ncbi:unnamed protein product [Cuscuta europaea]|uniref:Uncharacterized protein n=1 Tax=Cuscuta europaea TaxID=41803 RepID=A0A9P1E6J0_CUSEU|nr:unnamed protein product [Cuscuta europaea]